MEIYYFSEACKAAKDRGHGDIYLVPGITNNKGPYYLCDSAGSVLFFSVSDRIWEEAANVPKRSLATSAKLTVEMIFQYSIVL